MLSVFPVCIRYFWCARLTTSHSTLHFYSRPGYRVAIAVPSTNVMRSTFAAHTHTHTLQQPKMLLKIDEMLKCICYTHPCSQEPCIFYISSQTSHSLSRHFVLVFDCAQFPWPCILSLVCFVSPAPILGLPNSPFLFHPHSAAIDKKRAMFY